MNNRYGYMAGEYYRGRLPTGRWITFLSEEDYIEYMEEHGWLE